MTIDSSNFRKVTFSYPWKENMSYQIVADVNAFFDWYGLTNDTLKVKYKTLQRKDLGNILLQVDSLNISDSYVLELLDKSNDVIATEIIRNQTGFTKNYEALAPGNYVVRIIKDNNQNGRWDPVNYYEKRQAEGIFSAKIDELRANWDVDAKVIFREE